MTKESKKSFLLHLDSLDILEKMTDEQAGILFKAIAEFQKKGILKGLDQLTEIAITPFVNQFLRDDKKWEDTRSKRKESGKIGGKKSGELRKQIQANEANASNSKQTEANEAVSVNVSVSVNDINTEDNLKLPATRKISTFPPSEVEFENFWKSYIPVKSSDGRFTDKGAKKPALQSFKRLLAKGHSAEVIAKGVVKYLKHCQANDSPTCHATTFLNQERFLNEYDETIEAKSAKKKTVSEKWDDVLNQMKGGLNELS